MYSYVEISVLIRNCAERWGDMATGNEANITLRGAEMCVCEYENGKVDCFEKAGGKAGVRGEGEEGKSHSRPKNDESVRGN